MKNKNLFIACVLILCAFLFATSLSAQSRRNDIPARDLPQEVLQTLNDYAKILSKDSLEKAAEEFISVAGGGLVTPSGDKIDMDVPRFSLKKDFSNFKFYANPLKITRVNKGFSNGDGYGESAIRGTVYKIWIDKKKGSAGMPAPISILVPENHKWIKTPKVIGIGSL